ncbi:tetraprenyl-beta-curcumene synthase family protein [Rossellomorea marisflavi]|uniref:tetraprenyl-beta-curcumene synthase family protein n=1 Tax=Rossellomorea marisflavi TaxID=189381 RepID=UPI00203D2A8A|nr:tetraprenyl-beta-curcumene synthase family protein [Rossellomorea marisflavi]MCM2604720.1 tetraprenyl-beta-curcumene synthase family protein [Rossellomorea marisflavi]
MSIPSDPFSLMTKVYRNVFPHVHHELDQWKMKAEAIPNEELRRQALSSIEHKTFHCEGGGIMSLLSLDKKVETIRFIVAYQTISDYLDNLCDRSVSLDPDDFALLHQSMRDSLDVGAEPVNYYALREDQDDGGYLEALVRTCQGVLKDLRNYEAIKAELAQLCDYYCDLQIHKHVKQEERVERLQGWFESHRENIPDMDWYEFSACSGSTLGIFCLVSYANRADFHPSYTDKIKSGYFPYIQGLHILLDYFIDQEEDREGGDLNFCFYYEDEEHMKERLLHFLRKADEHTEGLPHAHFHRLINKGLIGVYLSDDKARKQRNVHHFSKEFINESGWITKFFYFNGKMYRKWRSRKKTS